MKAQNGGMLGVDRVGDRGSCALLTQNFLRKRPPKDKKGRNRGFGVFSGAISRAIPQELIPSWRKGVQSGPEQSRARQARAKRSLTARIALGRFPREGMALARAHKWIFIARGGQSR